MNYIFLGLLFFAALPITVSSMDACRQSDSLQIVALIKESKELYGYTDRALEAAETALLLARQHGFASLRARSYHRVAWHYYVEQSVEQANVYADSAFFIFRSLKDRRGMAHCQSFSANLLASYGAVELAKTQYRAAYESYRQLDDSSGMMKISNNLGVCLNERGRFAEGRSAHLQALRYFRDKLDSIPLARSYYNLGISQMGLEEYESAFLLLDSSYQIRHCLNRSGEAESLEGMSRAIMGLQDRGYFQMNNASKLVNDQDPLVLLDRASQIARKFQSAGLTQRINEALIKYHLKRNDYQQAFFVQEQHHALLDSTRMNKMNLTAFKSMREKLNREIQNSRIEKLENHNRLKVAEGRRLRQQRNFSFFLLLLGVLLTWVLIRNLWQRLQSRKLQVALQKADFENIEKENELKIVNAMLKGGEEERARISRDLHDSIGNQLTSMRLRLGSIMDVNSDLPQGFEDLLTISDDALKEVRSVAHNLLPISLQRLGLAEAVKELCRRQNQLDGPLFSFDGISIYKPRQKEEEMIIYRILQEVVQNIHKHAQATEAVIRFGNDQGKFSIDIEDNGIGWDKNQKTYGIGLANISSRVGYLKAEYQLITSPGQGTKHKFLFK